MSINATLVSKQWASRPNDQRFLSLEELAAYVGARNRASREKVLDASTLRVGINAAGTDLHVVGPEGNPAELTHWSFGQLCSRASAPAHYLRTLPSMMAAANLQWSLEHREADDGQIKVLVSRESDQTMLKAVTSTSYGRIWDADVVAAVRRLGDGWKVPAASYQARDPKRATTLYASDRDVFIFLVREQDTIDIGHGQAIKRGLITYNSEVGAATFGLMTFTYDFVCDNRIIWGMDNLSEIKIRHSKGAPERMLREALPQINAYANANTRQIAATVQTARTRTIGQSKDEVVEWLTKRGFTQTQAKNAYAYAERDERGQSLNPRSVWGVVQGLTDYAHEIPHTDARTDLERKAGALLDF